MRLRQGRKVGRTLYRQLGDAPSDADVLVGLVDTPELAAVIVAAVNSKSDVGGRDEGRHAFVPAACGTHCDADACYLRADHPVHTGGAGWPNVAGARVCPGHVTPDPDCFTCREARRTAGAHR